MLRCQAKTPSQRSWLLQVARFLLYDHISAGTILMKQGDKGDHMYIILSGQANVHIANNKSFKNVVHAIQHTQFLSKLVTSSKARVQAGAAQSQTRPMAATPSLTASAAEPAGDADTVKANVTPAGPPKRLSRFGQDTHAAAAATSVHVTGNPQQRGNGEQHDSSVSIPASTSQPALPTSHRVVKPKQGLGRSVKTAVGFIKKATCIMAEAAVSESLCCMLSKCP